LDFERSPLIRPRCLLFDGLMLYKVEYRPEHVRLAVARTPCSLIGRRGLTLVHCQPIVSRPTASAVLTAVLQLARWRCCRAWALQCPLIHPGLPSIHPGLPSILGLHQIRRHVLMGVTVGGCHLHTPSLLGRRVSLHTPSETSHFWSAASALILARQSSRSMSSTWSKSEPFLPSASRIT